MHTDERCTHVVALVAVDVPGVRLPLRITIAAVGNLRERVVDVVVERSVLAKIDLVAICVRIRAGGMA